MQNHLIYQITAYVYPWNRTCSRRFTIWHYWATVDLMTLQTEINGAIEYDLMINPAKSIKSPIQDGIHRWNNLVRFQRILACCLKCISKDRGFILLVGQRNEALEILSKHH
ncbi:MAG: hypothetical protein IPO72_18765 [Saprospiraceae bacterium]|nr:hypothetical protein [Candidatus Vicinibacter affinis]